MLLCCVVAWHGVAWRAMAWCGVLWCGVVWCGVVWCGVVWCGVVWCGVVWCGVVWCGVVWCGVVCSGRAWRVLSRRVGCGVVSGVGWGSISPTASTQTPHIFDQPVQSVSMHKVKPHARPTASFMVRVVPCPLRATLEGRRCTSGVTPCDVVVLRCIVFSFVAADGTGCRHPAFERGAMTRRG